MCQRGGVSSTLVSRRRSDVSHRLGAAAYDVLGDAEFHVLNDLAEAAQRAAPRVALPKGGHVVDTKKRKLALISLELFEKWRPGEARKTSGDFPTFAFHVHTAATGQKDSNLERAIDWAFSQMFQSGDRRPTPMAQSLKSN